MRTWSGLWSGVLGGLLLLAALPAGATTTSCLTGTAPQVASDPGAIRAARSEIDAQCPCDSFDGTSGNGRHAYRRCATGVIDGLIGSGVLRAQCRTKVRRMMARSTCGFPAGTSAVVCLCESVATGALSCAIRTPASSCHGTSGVDRETKCTSATHCIDAADSNGDLLIAAPGDSGQCAPNPTPTPALANPGPYPTGPNGQRLAELVNAYRVANGKAAFPLSPVMMAVAGAHVYDLTHSGVDSGVCTPHSWSNQGGLLWTGCCYTLDDAQADCMWRKPREVSAGLHLIPYTGTGFEIALRGTLDATPEQVLGAFTNSPPHRDVILSTNGWEFLDDHPAMGAATRGIYSVVWFGNATDPN